MSNILQCALYIMYCSGWIISLFDTKWSLAWEDVWIGQMSRSRRRFEFLRAGRGYPSRSLTNNFKFSLLTPFHCPLKSHKRPMTGLYGDENKNKFRGRGRSQIKYLHKKNHMNRLYDHDNNKGLECIECRNILTTSSKITEDKYSQNECTQKTKTKHEMHGGSNWLNTPLSQQPPSHKINK